MSERTISTAAGRLTLTPIGGGRWDVHKGSRVLGHVEIATMTGEYDAVLPNGSRTACSGLDAAVRRIGLAAAAS